MTLCVGMSWNYQVRVDFVVTFSLAGKEIIIKKNINVVTNNGACTILNTTEGKTFVCLKKKENSTVTTFGKIFR